MKILYNFPSRSRPDKLISSIENIIELSASDNYSILVKMDVDDTTCANKEFNEKLKSYGSKVMPVYGFSKGKVDAINKDIWMINDWNILATHSDDFIFTKRGFDLDIIEEFDSFEGLVHFPDGRVNEQLCTYPLMSRAYYSLFYYVYYPEYKSVFCDNEQTEVAKILGAYKYVNKKIMQHQHYRAGFGQPDELMLHNDSSEMYRHDGEIYYSRKAINFGIK